MNTYQNLLQFSNLFTEEFVSEDTKLDAVQIINIYNSGRETETISYLFCTNYQLFRVTANKFFGLSTEDKDSFILEEISKALVNFDAGKSNNAKLTTIITAYIYNRLRTETQALQAASKCTLNLSTSFEDLGDMERLEEAGDSSTYSYSEMYELVNQLDLTENERKTCEIIMLNEDVKNADIANMLEISRAGVGHIKKSLKLKLAPVFNISI